MPPRRSERLKEKNMSSYEENAAVASPAESDDEKTMIEMDQPSVAELKEEIVALKNSLQKLLDASKSSISSALLTTETQLPVVTTLANSLSSNVSPAVAANNLHSTLNTTNMPASTTPMQHQKVNICEYTMPFQYSLPQQFTTARSFVPTTSSLPYSSAQTFVQTSMPYYNTHSHVPTPYTVTQKYTPTTTSFSTSVDNIQQRFTQMYTSAPSHQQTYPPVTSTNLPIYTTAAPLNMTDIQSANDCRQLRKLHDLPPFSGQPEQWPMFIVAYRETTINYNYSNLENLIRLQKSLKGDARAKVESFLIHPDTVNQVVSTLEFHYGRPQLLIRSQIAKVRAIPSITEKRMYEIVNFSTMVSNLSAFLLNANATAHLSNPTLLDELVNKLPLQKREEWTKHSINHLGPYPSVHDFSLWLQEVATYISLSLEADPGKSEVIYHKKEKSNPSFTIVNEDNRLTKCPMCQQNHLLYHCDKFKEIPTNERWQFVKNNHLCFGCLRAGHNSFKCKNRRQCGLSKCVKYHNRLLHEDLKLKRDENNIVDCESSNTIAC
ncbi:uncharacterized protein LOC111683055 [Lucilia cuprina]|uniref:uncharacterized protein LOC111683055 n=1 Tax=Lucilia cuprina TaxID=7375 RepID=UPI001F067552|nr:uncharacterized protein LOC111683055 [Lucilia cuprina]